MAKKVLTAMDEKIRSGTQPAVVQIVRTARPALIELSVDVTLRNWVPPKRRQRLSL
jgi:hypothetical protein